MTINDGKGIYDAHGMIAMLTKHMDQLADAQGVRKCAIIIEAVQKLKALDEGITKDEQSHKEEVDSLRDQLEKLLNAGLEENKEVADNG